eukprot:13426080-Alexandrium_andersonii.AAC.1
MQDARSSVADGVQHVEHGDAPHAGADVERAQAEDPAAPGFPPGRGATPGPEGGAQHDAAAQAR